MSVAHVEVLVEEPSMEAALRILLPKLLNGTSFEVYQHGSKDQLMARLASRLRGYANFLRDDCRIVVVVDRDDDDCRKLKKKLDELTRSAGLSPRSSKSPIARWHVVNRLAIEELEAWFFGDWEAVRKAYPRAAPGLRGKAKYRDPDAVAGGTWEALERELQAAGYFPGRLNKIQAAREIAAHMDPARNDSASFRAFRDVMLTLRAA